PLNTQLGRQLRALILDGRISAGARLPSTRSLADDLGVSRATVVLAFEQLVSEGYIEGRRGSGMYVADDLPEQALQVRAPTAAKSAATRMPPVPMPGPHRPFQPGASDGQLFPHQEWSRLLYRSWRSPPSALLGTIDPFGWPPLREAIARHLHEWRGIACGAHQILITGGTADATELVAHTAFAPGAVLHIEDPGYPTLRYTLESLGFRVYPVPVDDDGFDIARAAALGTAAGAIIAPSRQFPLGATLPVGRRLQLLDWASAEHAFLVEDDFDSEYRYLGSPLPALMSLDRHGRTIYIGSFSKVLSPALRLGFVVLPEALIERARRHLAERGTLASLVAQPALAEFIASGQYATHIRRTRRIYARRMQALMASAPRLAGLLDLKPTSAGMHIVAELDPRLAARKSDRDLSAALAAAGIIAPPLAAYYAGAATRAGLLLGFAGFDEAAITTAAETMSRVLADL
ncbi:MAG TPA: PLP-dependent aminotransferase family protein, partial [Hyphomicrobiaceae bacterium]|nr:PLP-dependent aminotransferase family protein [Hyphomicrobiaceae bacterium]